MLYNKYNLRDVLLLVFGVLGIIWYVYSISGAHPFSLMTVNYTEEEILHKADSVFINWQYPQTDYSATVSFQKEAPAIDSLQRRDGIELFKQRVQNDKVMKHLPWFSWKVNNFNFREEERMNGYEISFSNSGEVSQFSISEALLGNEKPSNRYAVRSLILDNASQPTQTSIDSLVNALTNYQHQVNGAYDELRSISSAKQLPFAKQGKEGKVYGDEALWQLSDFYVSRTAWDHFDLSRDSLKRMDEGGIYFFRSFYSLSDSLTGITVNLELEVLPAGSLKSLKYEIGPGLEQEEKGSGIILASMTLFIVLMFSIWLFFVFYLRIKARAVDTKPAMVIAVIAGFLVPIFWLMSFIDETGLMYDGLELSEIINVLMLLGVIGAISAIAFFVIIAVSDSITRQYWPEKLKTWDLVRRGLFRNKPVGWGIIFATAIAGILTGLIGAFLTLVEPAYISADTTLISDRYYLPSVANIFGMLCLVLLIIVPTFLILGNQIKGLLKRSWIIPLLSALLFALLDILPFNVEPEGLDRTLRALIGLFLGIFYLRYDFLTTAFGFFVFVSLLSTSRGWLFEGSPDANSFYVFILVLTTFVSFGIYFIVKGSDRKQLPEYVPSYIEDQAKEQRFKQELSIARVVQETFLPSKIHHLPGIDMAGVCIPAQETGGDYYDMIPLGEQRTAIAIGDVSGKGIRAAFYMTFTKGVLHSLSALILSPVELLNQLNRLFNENSTRGTFISMIYGILEADKRQFTFARAGHNPMLVIRSSGEAEWLKPNGLGIGVSTTDGFIKHTQEATLNLKEGDVVILYTDGVTEMLNSGNHFYGEDRLERLVRGVRKASSEKILEIIVDDVNEFKGLAKQHDDMTLVIIKADSSVNR